MKVFVRLMAGAAVCASACAAAACARASSVLPAAPSAGAGVVITGTVSATNGGQPLANVSLAAASETVVTDAAGSFALRAAGSAPVVITGPSIVTRTTTLAPAGLAARSLGVFSQDGSFNLAFYRIFARNGFEQPARLEPIRRWTRAPQVYLRTIDEAGRAIDAATLQTAASALADSASTWTGDQFALAGLTQGTETREGSAGWITVKWPNPPAAGHCGQAQIGIEGGWIELNYLAANCNCGGASRIYSRLVRHELGHALGYYHTDSPADVMYGQTISSSACELQPSAREREYAKYVYSRPVGNTDPDNDPTSTTRAQSLPIVVQ